MAEARTTMLHFRVEPDAAARIEEQAARRGQSVSEYLREVALAHDADDGDTELAERVHAKAPGAVEELLALNPVSLVHRQTLGLSGALSLVLAYADRADDAGKHKLLVALVAGIERLTAAVPAIGDMERLATMYGRRAGTA